MRIPDDPKLQEDLQLIESQNYLTRYHACQRILNYFGITNSISSLRRVFSLIVDKRYPDIINSPEDFREARTRLLTFIEYEKHPQDLSLLDANELRELLIDALYMFPANDEKIRNLLAAGADFSVKSEGGMSAYLLAAARNNRKWMRHFVKQGADINEFVPTRGETAFLANLAQADLDWLIEMAGFGGDLRAENIRGEHVILIACSGKEAFKKVKWLHQKGVPLEKANETGETIVSKACEAQNMKLVRWLGAHGCNPDPIRNSSGVTPLLKAAKFNFKELAKALLEIGADPYLEGHDGRSAYQIALDKGHLKIAIMIKGEAAKDEFEKSKDRMKIKELKEEIISRLKSGKTWTTADKEGHGKFWWNGKGYQYKYQEHLSDYGSESIYKTDKKALAWLYDREKYGLGSETMVKIYESILRRLSF